MDSFESERGTRVDAFVAWDRFRVCACVDCRDQVVTQTWGLHVRSTTTSDDTVIVMRLIAMRGVGVSPSLFRCSLVVLFRFLFLATRDTSACHLLSLHLSLHLRVSHPRTLTSLSRCVSFLILPARPSFSMGITRTR